MDSFKKNVHITEKTIREKVKVSNTDCKAFGKISRGKTMITDEKYEELKNMLEKDDLIIKCSAPHQEATKNDRIDKNPEVIFCRWKRNGILVGSIEMTNEDLSDVIKKLQDDGLAVPQIFYEISGTG